MVKSKFNKAIAVAVAAGMILTATSALLSTSINVYAEEDVAIETEAISENPVSTLDLLADQPSTVSDYSNYFAGGDGTKDNPYQIASADHLQNIGYCSDLMATTYVYFELTANIDLNELTNGYKSGSTIYLTNFFNGEFNGNEKTITAAENCHIWLTLYTVDVPTFKSLEIQDNSGMFGLVVYSGYYYSYVEDNRGVNFESIYMYGSKSIDMENNDSAFVCIGLKSIYFYDCYNEVPWNMTGYGGIFVGGYSANANVSYIECVNAANVTGVYVGFFNGNTNSTATSINIVKDKDFSDANSSYCNVYIKNCENNGTLTGTSGSAPFAVNINATYNATANETVLSDDFTDFLNSGYFDNSNALSNVTCDVSNGAVTFSGTVSESVSYYIISVYTSISLPEVEGSSYVRIDKKIVSDSLSDVSCLYYNKIIGSSEYETETGIAYTSLTAVSSGTEDYMGANYKIILNDDNKSYTIVVSSESLISIYSELFPSVTTVGCESKVVYYRLSAYDGKDEVIGSMTYTN